MRSMRSMRRADNCEEASPEELFCGIEPQLLPLPDLLHHLHFRAPEPQSSRYIGFKVTVRTVSKPHLEVRRQKSDQSKCWEEKYSLILPEKKIRP
jgi:hypothetical protein